MENQQTESRTEEQSVLDREVKTDSAVTSASRDLRNDTIETSTITEQVSDEEITTIVREYDTEKPTNAATGTPPLKREITQSRRKVDSGRQTQTTAQTIEQQREASAQATEQYTDKTVLKENSQQHIRAVSQYETTEKRRLNAFRYVLLGIGVLSILWLYWKFKRNQ